MSEKRILIVDDDPTVRRSLARELSGLGYRVQTAEDGLLALDSYQHFAPHLVLTDACMPHLDGLDLLRQLKQSDADLPVILMSGTRATSTALEAQTAGAAAFFAKPLDLDRLERLIREALGATTREADCADSDIRGLHKRHGMVGSSPPMHEIYREIDRFAPTRATVLITGESGTGKELIAAAIHNASLRRGRFVRVHCAALAESLLESELFGHERGAFTGALRRRAGRFEQANDGTLMLDEIGEISATMQVKLLRVLQERSFERVGSNETCRVNVRIIAATHRDLRELVAQGRFREDLYYRLNVITLRAPALRERPSDIPELVEHMLTAFAGESAEPEISERALQQMMRYAWPGNVRELENVLQRALVFAEGGRIEMEHLPSEITGAMHCPAVPTVPGSTMLDFERYAITKALEVAGGSPRRAADMLGISVRKIQYRLREWANPIVVAAERHRTRRVVLRATRAESSLTSSAGGTALHLSSADFGDSGDGEARIEQPVGVGDD